jgi:tetratricopeptide (TPR) repeat protein
MSPAPALAHNSDPRKTRFAAAAIILMTVTLGVMGRLCFNSFTTWDDDVNISRNALLNPPTIATLEFYWRHFSLRLYAPLTCSLWTLLALIARVPPDHDRITLDPLVYHSASVMLHVLGALVVCRILLLMGARSFAALCGSLVFAVHPIQVEAVAWASGLKDVLSGLLALTALWQYLQYAINAQAGAPKFKPWLICCVALILAMLAKSSAASVPVAAVALDRLIVGRRWKSLLPSAGFLAALAIPFVFIGSLAQAVDQLLTIPLWQRPLIAGDSLFFYALKLLWPAHLCIDYGRSPQFAIRQPSIYFTWLVPAAICLALTLARKQVGPLLAAALVFFSGCLPTLGFIPLSMQYYSSVTDHYLYWAMLGPAMAVGWLLTALPRGRLLHAGVVAAIAGWSILSIRQGAIWKDDISLFTHTIEVNPKSFLSYSDLGSAYYRQGNDRLAAEMYRRCIEIKPDDFMTRSGLAAALRELGQSDEAIQELQMSISLQRGLPPASRATWFADLKHLGRDLLEKGQPHQAAAILSESLATKPDQPDVIALLARADALMRHPAATQRNR